MRAKDEKLTLPPRMPHRAGLSLLLNKHTYVENAYFAVSYGLCVFAHKSFVLTIVNRRSVQIVKWIKRGGGRRKGKQDVAKKQQLMAAHLI